MSHFQFFDEDYYDITLPSCIRVISEDQLFTGFFGTKLNSDESMMAIGIEPVILEKQIEIPNFNSYKKTNDQKKKE